MGPIGNPHWRAPAHGTIFPFKGGAAQAPPMEIQAVTTLTETVREHAQDALLATGAAVYFGGFILAIETALERLIY